jgi:hypothetical protein
MLVWLTAVEVRPDGLEGLSRSPVGAGGGAGHAAVDAMKRTWREWFPAASYASIAKLNVLPHASPVNVYGRIAVRSTRVRFTYRP